MGFCYALHVTYFTLNYIAFPPSLPVLRYIKDYLVETPVADQLPLHEVFRLLRTSDTADLPDPSQILDYLDLYVVVPLYANALHNRAIATLAQPQPFIFDSEDNIFRDGTEDPTNPNLVHVNAERDVPTFDRLLNLLSPDPRLYWQLSTDTKIVLAMVILQIFDTHDVCDEIGLIEQIGINLHQRAIHIRNNGGGRGGGAAGHGGAAGCGGAAGRGGTGGGARRGRSGAGGARHSRGGGIAAASGAGGGGVDSLKPTPIEPQHKKARRKQHLALRSLSEASDQSFSRKKPFGVHPETWVVASKFTTLVDEKFERPSSYFGTSVPSLHEADYKDDPSTWHFGPWFRSDMIIAAPRRMMHI